MSLYPIMLKLENRLTAVVGGGEVALRKITDLVKGGARIKVISPEILPEIEELAKRDPEKIEIIRRPYMKGDLLSCSLVYSATDNPDVNHEVFLEAEEL